jgi:hypothetical protein
MGQVKTTLFDLPAGVDRAATLARIEARCVRDESGCLLFQGFVNRKGYGAMCVAGKAWTIHRLAYALAHGPIPSGMFVCHRCDRPNCCEPSHFFLGDHTANQRDMVAKGRHAKGRKKFCRRGHPLTGDNVRISKGGFRNCKECARIRLRVLAGWPEDLAETMPPTEKGQRPMGRSWKRVRGNVATVREDASHD